MGETTASDTAPREGASSRLPGALGRVVHGLDRALAPFWDNPLLYGLLVLAAVYAGIWGFSSFYGPQFARTPWWAWPFIPDSPGATTMWLLASIATKAGWDLGDGAWGRGWTFFGHLAIVLNAKVGLWTVFVLFFYYDHFFTGSTAHVVLEWVLVVAHLGMVPFALLLFRKLRRLPTVGYLGILGLSLLGDFVDYALVPLFFPESGWTFFPNGVPAAPEWKLHIVALVTIALGVAATTALAWGMRMRGPPVDRDVPDTLVDPSSDQ